MDPALWELLEEGESQDEVAAIIRLRDPGVVPPGVRVVVQFGPIATVRLLRGAIPETRADEATFSFKAPFLLAPDPEVILPGEGELPIEVIPDVDSRRPSGPDAPTGRGVVVGVVDWGLDFAHPDFRHEDGTTRLLALWDQQAPPGSGAPNRYQYGRIHTPEMINHALQSPDPYGALNYRPYESDPGRGSHGTHTTGIAAGNGRSGGPVGVAPEADLVFVHLATWGQKGMERLGDSVTLLEAIDFIARTAGDRPWVINLSLGKQAGEHDGLSPVEQGLDAAVTAAPGRFICHSTGNYYDRRNHAFLQLRPGEVKTLTLELEKSDLLPQQVDIWYPGRDRLLVEVSSPDGNSTGRVALGEQASIRTGRRDVLKVYHRETDPNNLDNHVEIYLYPGMPPGEMEIRLTGEDVVDGRVHAWIERDALCPGCQPHFDPQDVDPTSTTGTICNGFHTVAVGAYNPHEPDLVLGPFSSSGRTRDGRQKPDLIAPGVYILAARSAPQGSPPGAPMLTRMSGTSMAAPHVVGTVALMFEVSARPLMVHETRSLLLTSTDPVEAPPETLLRIGSGRLNIDAAIEATRKHVHVTAASAVRPVRIEARRGENQPEAEEPREDLKVEAVQEVDVQNSFPNNSSEAEIEPSGAADRAQEALEAEVLGEPEDFPDGLGRLQFVQSEPESAWSGEEAEPEVDTPEDAFEPEASDEAEAAQANLRADYDDREETWEPATEGFPAESAEISESVGLSLIEIVDDAISSGGLLREPGALLEHALSAAGVDGRLVSPAALFDSLSERNTRSPHPPFEQIFEALARPGEAFPPDLREGDLLLRRGEGGFAHVAFLASPELWSQPHLMARGLTSEGTRPGLYAQVVEGGAFPHGRSDSYARLVADAEGRLPHGQMLLRLKPDLAGAEDLGEWTAAAPSLFSGKVYTSGWTHFMPFELGGRPHYLAYKVKTGQATIDRIRANAAVDPKTGWPVDTLFSTFWTAGWTAFMPFRQPGDKHVYYLSHKAGTGEMSIDRIWLDGKGDDTIWSSGADPGNTCWTAFVPFEIKGKPHFLAYKAATGDVSIERIKPDGQGSDPIWGTKLDPKIKWSPGWTHFMPFELGGKPHYLAYKIATGDVDVDRIKPDGLGVDTIWGTSADPNIIWTTGWSSFLPFVMNGRPHYLAYKADTGRASIDRIRPDGKDEDPVFKGFWAPGWTSFIRFPMNGKPHYFGYATDTGWVAIGSLAHEMEPHCPPPQGAFDPSTRKPYTLPDLPPACLPPVLGNFPVGHSEYDGGTKTILGDTFHVCGNVFYPAETAGVDTPFNAALAKGGPVPIVFIVHGRHDPGVPNYKGYDYFQEELARMGVIAVSIDQNDTFLGGVPTNIQVRAELAIATIAHFQSLHTGGHAIFGGRIDFSKTGLMGHSRGGEAVMRVPEVISLAGVKIKCVLALAPSDFGATSASPHGFALLVILPAGDGDLKQNYGARFYDQAQPGPFKAQLYIHDANHNYFNRQWTNDDADGKIPTLMTRLEHEQILSAYGGAFFRTVLLDDDLRWFLDGIILPDGTRTDKVHLSFAKDDADTVDDHEGHGIGVNSLGKSTGKSGGLSADVYPMAQGVAGQYNRSFFGNSRGMVATASTTAATFRSPLVSPKDLSLYEVWVRAAEVYAPPPPGAPIPPGHCTPSYATLPAGTSGFLLGLEDTSGTVAWVNVDDVGGLPRPYDRHNLDEKLCWPNFTKTMLKTIRFPAGCFTLAKKGFKITSVRAILLRLNCGDSRAIAFDDLQIVYT